MNLFSYFNNVRDRPLASSPYTKVSEDFFIFFYFYFFFFIFTNFVFRRAHTGTLLTLYVFVSSMKSSKSVIVVRTRI
jgi:hypothetical protein